ncbi:MAG TPA: tetratricopeptide repeat protein, partial [Planctomycetota bacterium]|nr:tetratricopeptide repeat protein [Planctomycetota bacterium]
PMVAARALFDAKKYAEAAEAFRAIVEKDPKNGEAWFDLGYSLHITGQLDQAIAAHTKAAEFPTYRAAALYNLGCAHALAGHADAAFEALNAAIDSGFNMLQTMQDDPDLKSLRTDPRYASLVARLSPAKV